MQSRKKARVAEAVRRAGQPVSLGLCCKLIGLLSPMILLTLGAMLYPRFAARRGGAAGGPATAVAAAAAAAARGAGPAVAWNQLVDALWTRWSSSCRAEEGAIAEALGSRGFFCAPRPRVGGEGGEAPTEAPSAA
jgi:hypothetical protein